MSKEIVPSRPVRPVGGGDCLSISLSTIIAHLAPDYFLHPVRTESAFPSNSDEYLVNFFDLLAKNDLEIVTHDLLRPEKENRLLFRMITTALQEGALCELTVKGRPWAKNILGEQYRLPGKDKTHSIVVYGYYQPDDNKENTWFYIADGYGSENIFLDWERLFEVLHENRGRVSLNLFSLFNNHSDLLKKYSVKEKYVKKKVKKKLLERIPGKTTKEKLSYLLKPRESTLRRRN